MRVASCVRRVLWDRDIMCCWQAITIKLLAACQICMRICATDAANCGLNAVNLWQQDKAVVKLANVGGSSQAVNRHVCNHLSSGCKHTRQLLLTLGACRHWRPD